LICIGCGCDEGHACNVAGEGCSWVHIGPLRLAGICSACLELFPPSVIGLALREAEESLLDDATDQAINAPERPSLILPGDADFHL
jgi:hypothetical protein